MTAAATRCASKSPASKGFATICCCVSSAPRSSGAQLSVANRDRLMALPGMPRHRDATDDEARGHRRRETADRGAPRAARRRGRRGTARRRAVAISNRNLGTNHGHVAWQRGEQPRLFRIHEDPILSRVASFLTVRSGGGMAIEELGSTRRRTGSLDRDGRDASDRIEWATVGQRVLRAGRVTPIEEIAARLLRRPARAGVRPAARSRRAHPPGDLRRLPGDVCRQRAARLARARRAPRPLRAQRRRRERERGDRRAARGHDRGDRPGARRRGRRQTA